MHTTLTPNIQSRNSKQIKGRDISPLTGESFGRRGIGPWRKNFVMPKELAHKLIIKLIRGSAWLKLVKEVTV